MALAPFERIIFTTELSEEEVSNRMLNLIKSGKPKGWRFLSTDLTPYYYGTMKGNTFRIRRYLDYRNTFAPVITGTLLKDAKGTIIHVRMLPDLLNRIVMSVFAAIFITAVIRNFNEGYELEGLTWLIVPLAVILGMYLFVTWFFKIESLRSRDDLQKLFEARIIKK